MTMPCVVLKQPIINSVEGDDNKEIVPIAIMERQMLIRVVEDYL